MATKESLIAQGLWNHYEDRPAMTPSETPSDAPHSELMMTFSRSYLDGVMKSEHKEIRQQWEIFCEQIDLALAELAAAREEARRDKEDAARYRWLRMNPNFMGWDPDFLPNQVDAAIDAARKEAK